MEPSNARLSSQRPVSGAHPRRGAGRKLLCLLTTLHPERALSDVLVQHLTREIPDMEFTLATDGEPDVVWVCGYEPGAEGLVADLRGRQPDAFLVVTGRGEIESWEEAVLAAGADFCCGWPVPVEELSEILHAPLRRGLE